jgi:MAE_28990/MAE_18760-like HEPN
LVQAVSRPYTEADFCDQITADRNWRIKEISDLKNAVNRGDASAKRVLLRALVTICYAHWEGYVKLASRRFLEHIALRKFRYDQLDRQFFRNYFLPRLGALSATKSSVSERCSLIDDILSDSNRRFGRVNDDLINTKSNLNFEVFTDICLVCGLSIDSFAEKATFVDIMLLKRRNAIAHGEETMVSMDDLDDLTTETVALMRAFGDALENIVVRQGYRAV